MRVLLVTYHFPPSASVGALRPSSLAEAAIARGHEVRVLSTNHQSDGRETETAVPLSAVLAVRGPRRSALPATTGGQENGSRPRMTRWRRNARRRLYRLGASVVHLPDRYNGWATRAARSADTLLAAWPADVVVASGPPFSAFLVAASVSRRHRIPWVADYRDPWSQGPYYPYGRLRRDIDRWIERRTLRHAGAVMTVSQPLADGLTELLGRKVDVVLNGYASEASSPHPPVATSGELSLVYTGQVHLNKRDLRPLLQALALLDKDADVRVHFYGPDVDPLPEMAERLGCARNVVVHRPVPHHDALRLQRGADVLLLLMWNHPGERGVYTGKLFEYVGARRPILVVNFDDGVAAELVRSRNLGVVASDPAVIARQLSTWLAEKRQHGRLAAPDGGSTQDLSRAWQNARALDIIEQVACLPSRGQLRGRPSVRGEADSHRQRTAQRTAR